MSTIFDGADLILLFWLLVEFVLPLVESVLPLVESVLLLVKFISSILCVARETVNYNSLNAIVL